MKKQIFILFALVVISVIAFTSCEPFIENKIIIKNETDTQITLNIRAKLHDVSPHETLILNDFKKGVFEYETVYTVPDYALTAGIEGDFAGELLLNAGTEIIIYYDDSFDSESGAYSIFASMTSSDDINRPDPFEDTGN